MDNFARDIVTRLSSIGCRITSNTLRYMLARTTERSESLCPLAMIHALAAS